MATASAKLISLADKALRLKMTADEAARLYKEAQDALYAQLEAEKMLSADTKGLGDLVRVKLVPNRFFSLEKAEKMVTQKVLKECKVTATDPKLLKQHLTGIQLEQAMESYPKAYKLSVEISD